MDLQELKNKAKEEIEKIVDIDEIERVFKKYLGKGGQVALVFETLKNLAEEERKAVGLEANVLKKEIEEFFNKRKIEIKETAQDIKQIKEKIDITRPGQKTSRGHLHPLTLVMNEACAIFQTMGFEIAQGPELETEWYNFDALNVPKDHPARDMQDTFWLKRDTNIRTHTNNTNKSNKLVMRTHTSPVQARYMETHQPPFKIVAPGRVFRNEATDAKHEAQFYQIEGLMVDKEVSASNFKAVIEEFLKRFFKTNVEIRLRPGYFPFVEPGFEIDAKRADGNPARNASPARQPVGSHGGGHSDAGGWMEIMGAGMTHPNVFKAAGLNVSAKPGQGWQGFAFGVGVDRLAMIRYKIPDIRIFYQNDLRFLTQF